MIKKGIGSRLGDSRDKWTHDLFDSPGGKDLRSRLDGDGPGRGGRFGAGGGRGGRGGRGGDLRTRIVREVRGERTRIVREVRGGRGGRGGMRSDFMGNRGVGSVGEFLRGIGLGRYAGTFAEEEIDMDALGHLRDKDLQSMGLPLGATEEDHSRVEVRVSQRVVRWSTVRDGDDDVELIIRQSTLRIRFVISAAPGSPSS